MSKKNKKSPKKAVEKILDTLHDSGIATKDLLADQIWNDLVEAGYIKARYAFYVGVGKIRNHFVD